MEKDNYNELKDNGYTIFPKIFDAEFVEKARTAIDKSYIVCKKIQLKNKVDEVTDGTVHHLIATGDSFFLTVLEKVCTTELYSFIRKYFNGNFILNSYGGVINLPSKPSYVSNIHRDIRFFSGKFPLMLNMLIMLDDFSKENGATYLLPDSHKKEDKPNEKEFYKTANRALGSKGDVLLFNSNLWHAAGVNETQEERKAITITLTKPFMKQQMDYCRTLTYPITEKLSNELKQLLGFYSRTPTNLYEWYQKPKNRFYRPNQD